uniref:Secreted protein n=1 Tax=Ixodes ricinus TaxID=34613 RepID=A0A6B0UVB9_IXORI
MQTYWEASFLIVLWMTSTDWTPVGVTSSCVSYLSTDGTSGAPSFSQVTNRGCSPVTSQAILAMSPRLTETSLDPLAIAGGTCTETESVFPRDGSMPLATSQRYTPASAASTASMTRVPLSWILWRPIVCSGMNSRDPVSCIFQAVLGLG